jgi:hypothetical protein
MGSDGKVWSADLYYKVWKNMLVDGMMMNGTISLLIPKFAGASTASKTQFSTAPKASSVNKVKCRCEILDQYWY